MKKRERETRKKNVIFHRVEEAGQRATNLEERWEWDICSCENIFNAMKLPINRNAIKFCRKIGEQSGGAKAADDRPHKRKYEGGYSGCGK